jgi:hypothetical protein
MIELGCMDEDVIVMILVSPQLKLFKIGHWMQIFPAMMEALLDLRTSDQLNVIVTEAGEEGNRLFIAYQFLNGQ